MPALNRNRCCHLALCLRLILFHTYCSKSSKVHNSHFSLKKAKSPAWCSDVSPTCHFDEQHYWQRAPLGEDEANYEIFYFFVSRRNVESTKCRRRNDVAPKKFESKTEEKNFLDGFSSNFFHLWPKVIKLFDSVIY